MTFDEWWEKPEACGDCFEDVAKSAWDAATAEVKKDHFKIGEEVYVHWGQLETKAKISAILPNDRGLSVDSICRIPAWKPKDGDPVLYNRDGLAYSGVYASGKVFAGRKWMVAVELKPWKPDCQGKTWDEV